MGEGWRCSWEVGFLQMLTTPVAADFSGGSSCSGATKVPCSDDGPVVAHKLTSCCYVSSVLFSLLIKWSLKRNTAVVLVDHDSSWWYEVRRRSSWVNGCCINKLVKHLPWYIMYFTSVKFIFLRVLIVLYIECYGAKWWCTKDLNMCNWGFSLKKHICTSQSDAIQHNHTRESVHPRWVVDGQHSYARVLFQ